jgi:lipoyl-dependent peroxiredoxin
VRLLAKTSQTDDYALRHRRFEVSYGMSTTTAPIAETISQGGRSGSVETANDGFRLNFQEPSDQNSEGLTPEHLFGAAWAACYHGAILYIARQRKHHVEGSTVTARVQRNNGEHARPFTVEMSVSLPGVDEHEAQRIMHDAHQMCCYTRATHGNVDLRTTLN